MPCSSLLQATLLLILASAPPALAASAKDSTGILSAVQSGDRTAAVEGFVTAGQAASSNAMVTALVQIFVDGTAGILRHAMVPILQCSRRVMETLPRSPVLLQSPAHADWLDCQTRAVSTAARLRLSPASSNHAVKTPHPDLQQWVLADG